MLLQERAGRAGDPSIVQRGRVRGFLRERPMDSAGVTMQASGPESVSLKSGAGHGGMWVLTSYLHSELG